MRPTILHHLVVFGLALTLTSSAFATTECIDDLRPPIPPLGAPLSAQRSPFAPLVHSIAGDTTWLRVHADSAACPGDPYMGHGGEVTGGPGPLETWCFENGDSCGTLPPWDTKCFRHVDVRAQPSETGINFWHVDTYRTDQRPYCGNYALWCGSDSLWIDGYPVECGTWTGHAPGYGNNWNCHVELRLPESFAVANGCTLLFDPRYDVECKYDYFYVDVWNGTSWITLAAFNATSNNPGPECGLGSGGNPDYWGNADINNLTNCDWQERFDPDLPAFYRVITSDTLQITSAPRFRWRFVSDAAWSDADGRGDTDGAAFIDNVWVWGDSQRYTEDFESGTLDTNYWHLVDPPGIIDLWHMVHDADPPYEGGDGGDRVTCMLDSSIAFRARPEGGYAAGAAWRNGWFYRLMTPSIPMQNSGCVVQWDDFRCSLDYTCDYTAYRVRFYDSSYGRWCPWYEYPFWICDGGCYFWTFDLNEGVSSFYDTPPDSMQFAWDIADVSRPGDACRGKHKGTDYQIDNVSIGFFDKNATLFSMRSIDMFHDTFHDNLCAYNSFFHANDPDTVARYSGPPYDDVTLPMLDQLYLYVTDRDGVSSVRLYGSVDEGASWVDVEMEFSFPYDPNHPEMGGEYYGTLCPDDFGLETWPRGSTVWYYVKATDNLGNDAYFPRQADPASPYHTGKGSDYFEFSILPLYPPSYEGPRILLVDGYGRKNYDYAECLAQGYRQRDLAEIYGQVLSDAGYCYDRFDIGGAWSSVQVQPVTFDYYDAVVWFTGPYISNYLFEGDAQRALRDYLATGGKVILCGDRISYCMAVVGEDSLGGEFLHGVMGCNYLEEAEGPFAKPYFYLEAVETLSVFGSPLAVPPTLDSMVIYRECPYLKDMSYVATDTLPPEGYFAQPLLKVLNPGAGFEGSDMAIYTESHGVGQCVFVNFDLCASVVHNKTYCSGNTASPAPDLEPGTYSGRVDLMRFILEDLFGLPSSGGGGSAGTGQDAYAWDLAQNTPNPCVSETRIRYEIPEACDVRLAVYNILGQRVCILDEGKREPGIHYVTWNGRNDAGSRVAPGVYFYRLSAGNYQATRKMLVLLPE